MAAPDSELRFIVGICDDEELRCYGLTSWAFRPIVEENASLGWKLLQALGKMLSDRQRA